MMPYGVEVSLHSSAGDRSDRRPRPPDSSSRRTFAARDEFRCPHSGRSPPRSLVRVAMRAISSGPSPRAYRVLSHDGTYCPTHP
ncbi:hypothetical protein R1flu_026447 [Riccia fluitans]|uniref:Uncharacterized protein n=1 Tax=Riccia fluitans TaxID=41844 RepID=A0ABD1XGK5_9MARC